MEIKASIFLKSAVDIKGMYSDDIPEFAFVGRSNVGKSSLLNMLVGKKNLAKTSSTPGHTKLINYFSINNNEFRFVDLPGYGFSKAGKQKEDNWSTFIEDYFQSSNSLKLVFLLVDIRHEPTSQDLEMCNYLNYYHIPYEIIATKADKIAKSKIYNYKQKIANKLCIGLDNVLVVSNNGAGREDVLKVIEERI